MSTARPQSAPPVLARLPRALDGRFGSEPGALRVTGHRWLQEDVLRVELDGGRPWRSVVAKRLRPEHARANRLAAERWLPALGLGHLAPRWLATLAEEGPEGDRAEAAWLVCEDLGDRSLRDATDDPRPVARTARAVAALHAAGAGHALSGEVRLEGCELGAPFLRASVEDALRAVEGLPAPSWPPGIRAALRARLVALRAELPARERELAELGGPETLLHGDLWPQNVALVEAGGEEVVRLLDWDHVGIGPPVVDLSTLLLRLPRARRAAALEAYGAGLGSLAWRPPGPADLNRLVETAEFGRIANRVIWPALALRDGDRTWAADALVEVASWFDQLDPCLP